LALALGNSWRERGQVMTLPGNNQQHLGAVADDSLRTFERIAVSASTQLTEFHRSRSRNVITNNTFTGGAADGEMRRIQLENLYNLQVLEREPAIARVVLADENDQTHIYYICRAAPISSSGVRARLASYRSPVGRLASLPVGTDISLRIDGKETELEVIEFARFQPKKSHEDWDSRNTVLQGERFGPLTIDSLRKLLLASAGPMIDENILDRMLAEDDATANVHEGLRRTVISRMDLKDQPILDQYQDEIFRLPLDSRLLILGAPGTGKTTTLIRRLGQKLDATFLEESERQVIERSPYRADSDHARSWIMFTPTELLKLYVKEAFNREGIPAPDERISTWSDYRDDLARNDFAIVRSASHGGVFVQRQNAQTISTQAVVDPIRWFTDFNDFQRRVFWSDLKTSAEVIVGAPNAQVSQIGKRLQNVITSAGETPQPESFLAFVRISEDIVPLVDALKSAVEKPILLALNTQLSGDKSFLEKFARFLESLEATVDDSDDIDAEDDDETPQTQSGLRAAAEQYGRAIRSLALARSKKKSVTRSSRLGRINEWIGERSPPSSELPRIAEILSMQAALRRFVNPVRGYLSKVPQRYRQFRRSEDSSAWYVSSSGSSNEIHPLETDIVLLAMMRCADELVTGARDLLTREGPARLLLEKHIARYRTQVLIDEATDFSPIQLAIMSTLARPGTRSVFACGDFNQRVTSWGAKSIDAINWAIPGVASRQIAVAYRQSSQLHNLAKQIVEANGDCAAEAVLPEFADGAGVAPALAENIEPGLRTARWLADRIREIDRFVGELPSIAVLVNSEDDVVPVSDALTAALEDQSIRVTACRNGQVKGSEGSVRVFNVEHIKGLEFEAVFFLEIDSLLELHPELFNKYLYVGATRAATYFGMTCNGPLPPKLQSLRPAFCAMWE
jgi:hypothetical protein